MTFWSKIIVGFICWPIEALMAMWGFDLLEHEGFALPTPGYWSCFVVSLGLGLLVGAAMLSRWVEQDADA